MYSMSSNGKINFWRSPTFPTSSLPTFLDDHKVYLDEDCRSFELIYQLCLYYPPQGLAFVLIVSITRSLRVYRLWERAQGSRMSWWISWQWLKQEQLFEMQLKEKKESIFSFKTLIRHCMILLIYTNRHLLN